MLPAGLVGVGCAAGLLFIVSVGRGVDCLADWLVSGSQTGWSLRPAGLFDRLVSRPSNWLVSQTGWSLRPAGLSNRLVSPPSDQLVSQTGWSLVPQTGGSLRPAGLSNRLVSPSSDQLVSQTSWSLRTAGLSSLRPAGLSDRLVSPPSDRLVSQTSWSLLPQTGWSLRPAGLLAPSLGVDMSVWGPPWSCVRGALGGHKGPEGPPVFLGFVSQAACMGPCHTAGRPRRGKDGANKKLILKKEFLARVCKEFPH